MVNRLYICIVLIVLPLLSLGQTFDSSNVDLQANITIMHRRSGATAITYDTVANGQTINYPLRNKEERFRVYSIDFIESQPRVDQIIVESYKNNRLLSTINPRPENRGNKLSFYDGYISGKENKVKVRLLFNREGEQKEWIFFVRFKKMPFPN
ncbi:MAG: hypothetical protein RIF39_16710 [Cyclobacteriaceae bacterium]